MTPLSTSEKIEISETLGGIANWYGLRARPSGFGGTPQGQSAVFSTEEALTMFSALRDTANVRHGVICYPSVLTEKEASSFELVPLNKDNGIEAKHLNSLPTSELQKSLVLLIATILNLDNDPFVLEELNYDGESLIRQTFKKTKLYKVRKEMAKQYQVYLSCMKTIKPEAIIAQLIEIKKEVTTDVKH
ncbi:MAG: hypothetical protein ACI87J_001976 [Colwellia sp.]|jgi:hypothetical protein